MRDEKRIPIVFLHGFTGSVDDWFTVAHELRDVCDPITINLVGHGGNHPPKDQWEYTIDAQTERIVSILDEAGVERFILLGYSMGGRIALNVAVNHRHRLQGLILESSTAGIEDEEERAVRRKRDEALAEYIEDHGVEAFIDQWLDIPLFRTQKRLPADIRTEIRMRKLRNDKTALAHTLRSCGTGVMRPLWDKLADIDVPVLLITGALDGKFTQINHGMAQRFPTCQHVVIDDAGHTVHLEQTTPFCNAIRDYISTITNKQ